PTPPPTPSPTPPPTPSPTPPPTPSPTPPPTPSPISEQTPSPISEQTPSPTPPPTPSPISEQTPSPTPPPTPSPISEQTTLPDISITNAIAQSGNLNIINRIESLFNYRSDWVSEIVQTASPLNIVSRSDITRLIDRGDIPQAIFFIDIFYSEQVGSYINQEIRRDLQSFTAIQKRTRIIASQTGKKPAIIYAFSRPEQLDLIVVPPSGIPIHKAIPAARRETLMQVAANFSSELTTSRNINTESYLPASQQLYQWIIAPLEADLKAQGIDTLVFSMDAGLRLLPLAALHDGSQFLVEKYSIGLIPSVNLTDTSYASVKNAEVLAMGASQFTNNPPLPAVPAELNAIASEWKGESFLNQTFTLNNLRSQRKDRPYGIIHLATHGYFNPGSPSNSYIQLSDSRLTLDRVRQLGWNQPPKVELLVLSACQTAVGDDDTELGFAGLAVQAGVKSVLASLWYVSDEGTLGLMAEFYHQLKVAPIKAEALRQAQIAMIKGQVRIENGRLILSNLNKELELPPELAQLTNENLSHPYYWSAFTMIGSPW
ncbi:CHAT domain-containing protein, partial [Microcoleus sp. B13-B6]|uniref:CHAT domain-containing protein n=1 Tax=Microcoleus sp. B13-B6 TaxID=2818652 RepID=UPI002FD40012